MITQTGKPISIYPMMEKNKNRKRRNRSHELSKLPFWCGDLEIHKTNPDTYHLNGCCLTHTVGLPQHPATNEPMPLTPYQVDFFTQVDRHKTHPDLTKRDALKIPHKFHLNKGRQMGFTEIVLRVIQYYCYHHYAGANVGIIAATNGSLARKDLRRFIRLFANIRSEIGPLRGTVVEMANGTRIEAFPASEEAMTGDTKYKCIFLDEAAKWKLVDDRGIFNSLVPIVNTNGADLFLVSTPKGPVKTFYEIYKHPKDYLKLEYPLTVAKGNLYDEQQIDDMIANAQEDPNQEYLCCDHRTEVLTDSGFKLFRHVTAKDTIATLNTTTGYIEYQKPLHHIDKVYDGTLIHVENQTVDAKLTPNHQMLTQDPDTLEYGFTQLDKLKPNQSIPRQAKWHGMDVDTITIGDSKINMMQFVRLMAWFLSEGSAEPNRPYIYISQYNKENRQKIYQDLKDLPNCSVKMSKVDVRIYDKSGELHAYCRQFGHAHEKYIPEIIKSLSEKYLSEFLHIYNLGDGYMQKHERRAFCTSSRMMRDDLGELILKTGKSPSFSLHTKAGEVDKRGVKTNHDYHVIRENKSTYIHARNLKLTPRRYIGRVYCVEVPNHTIYIRRTGRCMWIGNCKFTFGTDAILGTIDESMMETDEYEWFHETSEDDGYREAPDELTLQDNML